VLVDEVEVGADGGGAGLCTEGVTTTGVELGDGWLYDSKKPPTLWAGAESAVGSTQTVVVVQTVSTTMSVVVEYASWRLLLRGTAAARAARAERATIPLVFMVKSRQ
jgi:hypothetical protein